MTTARLKEIAESLIVRLGEELQDEDLLWSVLSDELGLTDNEIDQLSGNFDMDADDEDEENDDDEEDESENIYNTKGRLV